MSNNLLELSGVHTHIGAYHILHGVDLAVPRGQLTMLLGRNGAGKSTTLRTIMGLWQASQGSVRFNGNDITKLNTPQIAGMNIAYVPEAMGIFSDLTVKENMLLAARSAKNASQMDEARAGVETRTASMAVLIGVGVFGEAFLGGAPPFGDGAGQQRGTSPGTPCIYRYFEIFHRPRQPGQPRPDIRPPLPAGGLSG